MTDRNGIPLKVGDKVEWMGRNGAKAIPAPTALGAEVVREAEDA